MSAAESPRWTLPPVSYGRAYRGPVSPPLRYLALDGTDHDSHEAQVSDTALTLEITESSIRRYIAWRNRNAKDKTLRELVKRANVA